MTVIKIKNSNIAGRVPAAGDLQTAELALNLQDKRLYSKDVGGNVFEIGTANSGDTPPITGNQIGDLFYDTAEGALKYWDGNAWVELSTEPIDGEGYVKKSGDNMTGALTIGPAVGPAVTTLGDNGNAEFAGKIDVGEYTTGDGVTIRNGGSVRIKRNNAAISAALSIQDQNGSNGAWFNDGVLGIGSDLKVDCNTLLFPNGSANFAAEKLKIQTNGQVDSQSGLTAGVLTAEGTIQVINKDPAVSCLMVNSLGGNQISMKSDGSADFASTVDVGTYLGAGQPGPYPGGVRISKSGVVNIERTGDTEPVALSIKNQDGNQNTELYADGSANFAGAVKTDVQIDAGSTGQITPGRFRRPTDGNTGFSIGFESDSSQDVLLRNWSGNGKVSMVFNDTVGGSAFYIGSYNQDPTIALYPFDGSASFAGGVTVDNWNNDDTAGVTIKTNATNTQGNVFIKGNGTEQAGLGVMSGGNKENNFVARINGDGSANFAGEVRSDNRGTASNNSFYSYLDDNGNTGTAFGSFIGGGVGSEANHMVLRRGGVDVLRVDRYGVYRFYDPNNQSNQTIELKNADGSATFVGEVTSNKFFKADRWRVENASTTYINGVGEGVGDEGKNALLVVDDQGEKVNIKIDGSANFAGVVDAKGGFTIDGTPVTVAIAEANALRETFQELQVAVANATDFAGLKAAMMVALEDYAA